jgi:hypothetical protein
MYCSKCGSQVNLDQKFCSRCGNLVQKQEPIPSTTNRFIIVNNDSIEELPLNEEKQPTINNNVPDIFNSNITQNVNNPTPSVNVQSNVDNSIPNMASSVTPNVASNVTNNINNPTPSVDVQSNVSNQNYQPVFNNNHDNKPQIVFGIICIFFLFVLGTFFFKGSDDVYLGGTNNEESETVVVNRNRYKTSIKYDNVYNNVKLKVVNDAVKTVVNDSLGEKKKCSNASIERIENNIVNNYEIKAVNLCELDLEFAIETENVIKTIYNEFPTARGYLTNFTLVNTQPGQNPIAFFHPYFVFATSDTFNKYPYVSKMIIGLNSTYYLNIAKLENSIRDATKSGHFPKNVNRNSPVAHEFAHYLSFYAAMKSYSVDDTFLISKEKEPDIYEFLMDFNVGKFSHKMIKEAHQNYKTKYNSDISELEFRGSISLYALAKDPDGNYIYDETIAEAFSDWYVNKDNASKASIEVFNVLKKYIEAGR